MLPLIPELIGINQPLTKSFSHTLNGSLFLNVNAPNCPVSEVKGIQVVPQGRRRYAHRVTASVDQFGAPIYWICLLYTSDAADDLLCVDLGGRRIIKKK